MTSMDHRSESTSQPTCRKTPCPACPYRRDVPSGVWAPEEYEKLRRYDAPTADQPPKAFMCHATPARLCHGWAVVHSSRGHNFGLMALRFMFHDARVPTEAAVPLFSSGNEAADHGQRDVARPSSRAEEAMSKLLRYPRLAEANSVKECSPANAAMGDCPGRDMHDYEFFDEADGYTTYHCRSCGAELIDPEGAPV